MSDRALELKEEDEMFFKKKQLEAQNSTLKTSLEETCAERESLFLTIQKQGKQIESMKKRLETTQNENIAVRNSLHKWEQSWAWIESPDLLDELGLEELESLDKKVQDIWKGIIERIAIKRLCVKAQRIPKPNTSEQLQIEELQQGQQAESVFSGDILEQPDGDHYLMPTDDGPQEETPTTTVKHSESDEEDFEFGTASNLPDDIAQLIPNLRRNAKFDFTQHSFFFEDDKSQ
eukprot:TRINITY_DN33792_c0_g1_i1.p1 TRINITY_DN33792_c0_g1~~TRINITY_DN33792_c0_g1_i1.p1  ORF type:complete len:233 (+),score=83.30 TRINITY_DN33792_c0_g1_i1:781-1479(+)